MVSSSSSASSGGSTSTEGGHRVPTPNEALLKELHKAEKVCLKAQTAEYAVKLALREITPEEVTATLTKILQARAKAALAALATQATTGKQGVTGREESLKTTLLACVAEIQKAAKQKARKTPLNLDDYFVGKRLDKSRALLEQLAGQIIAKAGTSSLPGITPAKITAATTALNAYVAVETDQSGAQSDATDERAALKTMVREITDTRIAIQLAADAEWPHGDPANAAERREFQLPVDRPLRG